MSDLGHREEIRVPGMSEPISQTRQVHEKLKHVADREKVNIARKECFG